MMNNAYFKKLQRISLYYLLIKD